MIIEKTPLKDLVLITPNLFKDDRGYFMETYNQKKLEKVIKTSFVQDNESLSQKGVLRGLHFQKPPYSQAKLVRVIIGSILDVVVDIRKNSPTYGQHFKHVLSAENRKQLYVPVGFAHGFLCLENNTILNYKCSSFYNKNSESALLWNDKDININWGVSDPILAKKDKLAENFSTFENPF